MAVKIKFKDLPKNIKEAVIKAKINKAVRFYPLFVGYSLTIIFLIKFALYLLT